MLLQCMVLTRADACTLQQADKQIKGEKGKGKQEEKLKEEEAAGSGVMQVVQYHIVTPQACRERENILYYTS